MSLTTVRTPARGFAAAFADSVYTLDGTPMEGEESVSPDADTTANVPLESTVVPL